MAKTKAPAWALDTWQDLNDCLRGCDESTARELLEREQSRARPRRQFVMRIHSRINKVRADAERVELRKSLS